MIPSHCKYYLHGILRRLGIMAISVTKSPTNCPCNSLKKPLTSDFAFCKFYKATPTGYKEEIKRIFYNPLESNIHDCYIKATIIKTTNNITKYVLYDKGKHFCV